MQTRRCHARQVEDFLLDTPQKLTGSSGQDEALLVAAGRAARGAIAGELALVALDLVLRVAKRI